MNLSQLEYFSVLAKYEHYTRAAQVLSISQPSLTHSIKSLEQELGVSLFDRQGRQVRLNRYGRLYLTYVEEALERLKQGKDNLELTLDPTRGKIKLAYLLSLGPHMIPKLIREFKAQPGNAGITFEFLGGTTETIKEQLQKGDVDVALTSQINDKKISCIPLYKERLYAIVPKEHMLANKTFVTLDEISKYPFIGYKARSGIRSVIDRYFLEADITPDIQYEFTDDRIVCGFVEAGFGVAIMPDVEDINHYNVVKIPFKSNLIARGIYLSYMTKGFANIPVKKIIDYILHTYKE